MKLFVRTRCIVNQTLQIDYQKKKVAIEQTYYLYKA